MTNYKISDYSQKLANITANLLKVPTHLIVFSTRGLIGLCAFAIDKLRHREDDYFDLVEEKTHKLINCDDIVERTSDVYYFIFKYIWKITIYILKYVVEIAYNLAKGCIMVGWFMIKLIFIILVSQPTYHEEYYYYNDDIRDPNL